MELRINISIDNFLDFVKFNKKCFEQNIDIETFYVAVKNETHELKNVIIIQATYKDKMKHKVFLEGRIIIANFDKSFEEYKEAMYNQFDFLFKIKT